MGDPFEPNINLPDKQKTIRAKCFHPSGAFVEFKKEEIEQSIPDRFEQQVAKYPDRIAVKTRSHTLAYDALNRMANRVAHAIVAQRGEGNEPVALLLENDAPMVAAIIGVLKTGKIYVPLDPSYPCARITYILDDSRASMIVTSSRNLSVAKELAQDTVPLLNIDEINSNLTTENLGLSIPPDILAYIIYTSGSTGQPKGVVQNHRNVLHLIMRNTNRSQTSTSDRVALLRSFSVNGGVLHTFGALLNGALLLPFDLKREGIDNLAKWLVQEEITTCSMNPTIFRHLVATLSGVEEFPKLRLITFSGEPLHKRDVDLYKKHFSQDCILANSYGSTEASNAREYFIDKNTQITGENVPCGYAAKDMEVLLLDDSGAEVGINRIGEIAVKSRYLTPGYWRRPDLTKAAFLPDPEGGDERIYRTGDVGRMLADGCLLHLGRKDFQVKIRGYRIEVGEIETALLAFDTLKEAVVMAREDRPGDQRLVAYLVPKSQPGPAITSLRRALAEKLPDYMIPSAFVVMDALPLTPNGKVDRCTLPVPGRTRPELDAPFVSPRIPVEEALARIWAEVLGLDQVGIHDNFLDLGGHSLLATKVISRVIDRFRVELPMKSLLEAPTVAQMAAVVAENQVKTAPEQDLSRMLAELEALSDEEAQRLLARGQKGDIT